MGTPVNQRDYGVSWHDVKEHILEVRKAHNRPIEVKMSIVEKLGAPATLYVCVVSYAADKEGKLIPSTAEGHTWPANDWKSLAAMVLALLFRLDNKLSDYQKARERQSAF